MLVRAGGAHRAQAPVGGGGGDAGEPGFRVLRGRAVGVLGAQALTRLRMKSSVALMLASFLRRPLSRARRG